ncbi:glycosyl hydrolase [Paenibacillus soyae]|uniref:Glycosyl hydrolase n=1 Tax=Paenibacillus soyae TaxID=2969249 RepID=A0A9X2MT34_9BACL|nr:glycosyl hydrolase [Paenibacillus soyae]MCR2805739.1 glycosyl hydrolase [Paenibacillus soyae]
MTGGGAKQTDAVMGGRASTSSPDALAGSFAEPDARYRPSPLWAWNDEMTEELVREQLREMKARGLGGAFVNPRPGLVNPYLSEEWFSLWGAALEEAERLDMKLYVYDENSYPSGFAGGHVPAELPDCLATAVIMRELAYEELADFLPIASGTLNKPGHPIRVFALGGRSASGELAVSRDVTLEPFGKWRSFGDRFLLFEIGAPETNAWLGGFAYTDLLRPEVAELFLSSTYDAYRQRYGDKFGTVVPAIFTDEPEISPGNLFRQAGSDFLPFSYWFGGQFAERNGYDIKDYLPCLFRDVTTDSFDRDAKKVRYDYYDTIHELWVDNFFRPISAWCMEHGIAWTGHFVEHNWPYPWGRSSPAVMSLYAYMQWPAVDILRANSLRQPGHEGEEMLALVLREASSAANQLGRERVLCEAYGAGGWDSDFKDYKRIGDWLYAHGINFLAPHMILSSISGARKRDHPQSFDWRQSWWEEYGELNDYFGRLSYLLSQGETHNRILLLNPCLSAYLETPGSQQGELRVNDSPRHPDMSLFLTAVQRLCDRGFNYDLGDEYILGSHGGTEGTSFIVGQRRYDVVVVPDSMVTVRASTYALLEAYLEGGGVVLALGEAGSRINGSWNAVAWERLTSHPGWVRVGGIDGLLQELRRLAPPRLEWAEPERLPPGIHHLRRVMPDGSVVYFVANGSTHIVRGEFVVEGKRIERLDPWTGRTEEMAYRREESRLMATAELPPEGSLLVRVYQDGEAGDSPEDVDAGSMPAIRPDASAVVVPLTGSTRVTPERDNLLVLDYCDLKLGGKEYAGIGVLHAQKLVYEHHGFEANPWDNAVQFKRRLIDRNGFSCKSGFEVAYRFRVAPGCAPAKLELWAERGDMYQLRVNGQAVEWTAENPDLEQHLRAASIAEFVVEGDNRIELEARPFDIRMELEAVYLSGEFAVVEQEGGWIIDRPVPMTLGSWKEQGRPFYPYAAVYENEVLLGDTKGRRYAVKLPSWSGTVASLEVNGQAAGLFGVGKGEEIDVTNCVAEGVNRIRVRVCGSFKNLLGPFHDPNRTRKTAWPSFWKTAPVQGPPPAAEYDLLELGLWDDFEVFATYRS